MGYTMERAKKTRAVTRNFFPRVLTALEAELVRENLQHREIHASFALLRDKATELERLDAFILDTMGGIDTVTEQEMDTEILRADEY